MLKNINLQAIIKQITEFRDKRDWKKFHDSKNLALALSIEAAELNELFLWKTGDDVENVDPERFKEELADVLMFALLLVDKHQLDIEDIIKEKIKKNEGKYPADKARGRATKYTDL